MPLVNASAANLSVNIDSFDTWLFDGDNEVIYLYKYEKDNSRLQVLSMNDLSVKKEIPLTGFVRTMKKHNQHLYIGYRDEPIIRVFHLSDLSLMEEIVLSEQPFDFTVTDTKIYYAPEHSSIHEYDLQTKTDKRLAFNGKSYSSFYRAQIHVDEERNELLIGASWLERISLETFNTVSKAIRTNSGPASKLIIDGDDVFMDGHRFQYDQLEMSHGIYVNHDDAYSYLTDKALFVTEQYVYTSSAIYNRNTHVKVADIPNPTTNSIRDVYTIDNKQIFMVTHHQIMVENIHLSTETVRNFTVQNNELNIGADITSMILDENHGLIYALVPEYNALLLINQKSLEVEGEIRVGKNPKDMKLLKDKLYITQSGTELVVVDIIKKKIEATYQTTVPPMYLAATDQEIYYSGFDDFNLGTTVYRIHKETKKSEPFYPNKTNFRPVQLATVADNLYVANGSVMLVPLNAPITPAEDLLGHETHNLPPLIIEGDDLFYGKNRYSLTTPSVISADYSQTIYNVTKDYILSAKAVFNRHTQKKIVDLPIETPIVAMDEQNQIYLFDKKSFSLKRVSLPLDEKKGESSLVANELQLHAPISDWVYDKSTQLIYAVSQESNQLLTISPQPFEVLKEEYIGSSPTEIQLLQDKLFISFSGETRVLSMDLKTSEREDHFLNAIPTKMAVTTEAIFFRLHNHGNGSPIQKYDFHTKETTEYMAEGLPFYTSVLDLFYDEEKNRLYAGDARGSAAYLYAIDLNHNKVADQFYTNNNFQRNYHPASRIVKTGNSIYYVRLRLDEEDLSNRMVAPFDHVIYGNESLLINADGVTDLQMQTKYLYLPYRVTDAIEDEKGQFFLYNETNQRIYKYLSQKDITRDRPQHMSWNFSNEHIHFRWTPVEGAEGYNFYYKVMNSWDSVGTDKINKELITTNSYSIPVTFYKGSLDPTLLGVTAVVNGKESAISDMYAFEFRGRSAKKVQGDVIISDFAREFVSEVDGRLLANVNINEKEITGDILKKVTKAKNYELYIKSYADEVTFKLPEKILNLLKEYEMDFTIVAQNGAYTLPFSNPQYMVNGDSEITVNISTSDKSALEAKLKKDGLTLVGEPIYYSTIVNGQTVSEFGSTFVERWIPLPKDADPKTMVGVMITNKEYLHVPTTFTIDEKGQHWAVLKRNGNSQYAIIQSKRSFTDISKHWAKAEIELMASKQIVTGISDTQFAPDSPVTRAQFAALLTRAMGLKETGKGANFKDVSKEDWYTSSVATAAEAGLVRGFDDGTFRPNQRITRQEMVVMVERALEYVEGKQRPRLDVLNSFKDRQKIQSWASTASAIAVERNIIQGVDAHNFGPNQLATRSQSVVILKRTLTALGFVAE